MEVVRDLHTNTLHVHYESSGFSYPVGSYINSNKKTAIEMVEAFKTIEEFKDAKLDLICRGSSGAIIATIFAMQLSNNCRIIHVKKPGEKSHAGNNYYIRNDAKSIIVDDFIASGDTMHAMYDALTGDNDGMHIIIDCVCISGNFQSLKFKPRYFVHGD